MNSYLFHIKDTECSGQLETRLRRWRKEGRSTRDIAALLSASGVEVRRSTVANWFHELGIMKGRNGKGTVKN
jgi:DNA-directed RNA polymerase specialized sigma54-like protein